MIRGKQRPKERDDDSNRMRCVTAIVEYGWKENRKSAFFFFFCFVTLYINCLFSFVADLVHNYPYKSLLTWLGSKKEKREKRKAATMYTNNRIIQVMS